MSEIQRDAVHRPALRLFALAIVVMCIVQLKVGRLVHPAERWVLLFVITLCGLWVAEFDRLARWLIYLTTGMLGTIFGLMTVLHKVWNPLEYPRGTLLAIALISYSLGIGFALLERYGSKRRRAGLREKLIAARAEASQEQEEGA